MIFYHGINKIFHKNLIQSKKKLKIYTNSTKRYKTRHISLKENLHKYRIINKKARGEGLWILDLVLIIIR